MLLKIALCSLLPTPHFQPQGGKQARFQRGEEPEWVLGATGRQDHAGWPGQAASLVSALCPSGLVHLGFVVACVLTPCPPYVKHCSQLTG